MTREKFKKNHIYKILNIFTLIFQIQAHTYNFVLLQLLTVFIFFENYKLIINMTSNKNKQLLHICNLVDGR